MTKIDDILNGLQTAPSPALDDDAMLSSIMTRIDSLQQRQPKVIPLATRWFIAIRNVSSIAAILLLVITISGNAKDSSFRLTPNAPSSTQQFSADAAPGEIYAAYTQRKEMLKHSYKQLIRKCNEINK